MSHDRSAHVTARVVLILLGALWLVVAALGLLRPDSVADLVDFQLGSALARLEVRAFYGGLSLAIGALHLAAATRTAWLLPGTVAAGTLMAGIAGGRVLALVIDGYAGVRAYGFLSLELVSLLAAVVAVWRLVSSPAERPTPKQAPPEPTPQE